MPVKVLAANGKGSVASVINGMVFAVDNGADIINMSLGGVPPDFSESELHAMYDAVGSDNVLVVVAAGNESANIDEHADFWFPAEIDRDNLIVPLGEW